MQEPSKAGEFSLERLKIIEAIEREHFWFLGRRKLVLALMQRFIEQRVRICLDVGCGTGFNLNYWKRFSSQVIGLDQLAGFARHHQKSAGSPQVVISDVCALPVLQHSADVVVALDVLEHVPDAKMLAEVRRSLADGGLFFITVPAMGWLWSRRDEAAGHLRRYNRKTLRAAVKNAGFEILYLNFYQCLLFPVVLLSRIIGRSRQSVSEMEEKPGKLVNAILRWITRLEVRLSRLGMRFPWGSTLVAVARKAEAHEQA